MTDAITAELGKAAAAISAIDPAQIRKAADIIRDAFRNGNQVIFCGNGGSSADAQHIAAEFSGRYMMERPALPGVCPGRATARSRCPRHTYSQARS